MGSKRMLATAALTVAAVVCAAGAATLPAAASTAAATTAENTPQPGGPLIHPSSSSSKSADASTTPTISENWSGYAVTGKKQYTYVHSTFVQPSVTCSGVANQYTSNWVGLDGFNDQHRRAGRDVRLVRRHRSHLRPSTKPGMRCTRRIR